MTDERPLVIKVGGSLFDQSELGPRLRSWLDTLATRRVLLLPGGGPTADVIRNLDHVHALGEEAAHWLALRALSLNAFVLQALVPQTQVIGNWQEAPVLWARGVAAIVDALPFARADEKHPGHLPHRWEVTSDSLAVRLAIVAEARELILLKSVTIAEGMSWTEAARRGHVDSFFAHAWDQAISKSIAVRAINFREWMR
jgi:aspartokinase-like uncharacterized kinase